MSVNPDVDQIVPFGQPANGAEAPSMPALTMVAPSAPPPVFAVSPVYEPAPPAQPSWQVAPAQTAATWSPGPARRRSGWIVPAAIAAVGLIASGSLGYLLYATTGQRDAARHQLATTQVTLADTDKQLAARQATAAYVDMYVQNSGRVSTAYQNEVICSTYLTCRGAAQDALDAMKQFQSSRGTATVPPALASVDSQIGDALSAAIAGDQELITGLDSNDKTKFDDGYDKFSLAMLSFAKAESALSALIG